MKEGDRNDGIIYYSGDSRSYRHTAVLPVDAVPFIP
jgi:hypothetical protein